MMHSHRNTLTSRQQQMFDFIIEHMREHGYPPTLREMGDHMGIRSTNGVAEHLERIERKGYIKRERLRSRGITVLRQPEGLVSAELRAEARRMMFEEPADAEILIAEALRRRRAAS